MICAKIAFFAQRNTPHNGRAAILLIFNEMLKTNRRNSPICFQETAINQRVKCPARKTSRSYGIEGPFGGDAALDNLRFRQDEKVKQTIIVVLEEFFKNDNVSILYICDSSDGKQAIRNRLFSIWFSRYSNKNLFSLEQRSLEVNSQKYFISLLSKIDCPATLERINTLDQLMHSLEQK